MTVLKVKIGCEIPNGCDPPMEWVADYRDGVVTVLRRGPEEDCIDIARQIPHVVRMNKAESRRKSLD